MTRPLDALALLAADHETVRRQFAQYGAIPAGDPARRQALSEQICLALAIHLRLQDELLYPLMRDTLGDDGWVDQALDRHHGAQELVAQLMALQAHDPSHDDRLGELRECIEQLGRLEQERLFPALRQSERDFDPLAMRLVERKRELQAVPEALREEALVSLAA